MKDKQPDIGSNLITLEQENLFGNKQEREAQFELPEGGYISESALRRADRDQQVAVMRHWFYTHSCH